MKRIGQKAWRAVYRMLVRKPAMLANIASTKLLAGPGTLDYKGGLYNPGALGDDDGTVTLLAKGQKAVWYEAKGDSDIYLKGDPVVFKLDGKTLKIIDKTIIKNLVGFPKTTNYALEDFRLFKWKNRKIATFSWVELAHANGKAKQISVKTALAELDESQESLSFLGFPKIDKEHQQFEKNWVYVENNGRLFLFYNMQPYHVLALENENELTFRTVIKKTLPSKIADPGGYGVRVSYSVNPVDYDSNHWLGIIHQAPQKTLGRCYEHWAILIDKNSMLPVKITQKPIFNGLGARGIAGYRYISSVVALGDIVYFFAGEGDVYLTVAKKSRRSLDELFVPIV